MEGFYFVSPVDHKGLGEIVAYQNIETKDIISKELYNDMLECEIIKECDFIPLYEI